MVLIELKSIGKTYKLGKGILVPALKDVSLAIDPGEFIAIMGSSGSGKSTLLSILGLLDKADAGEYSLLGKNVTALSDNQYAALRSRYLGFIFQSFNLLSRFNIVDNAMLPFLYTHATKQDKERVMKILNKIGLGDRLGHRTNEISGGQQQRVAIARALANQPLIIFADEPTGNLDSKSAQEVLGLLKELNEQGTTIIMVTHELELAQLAGRIITLKDGVVISDQKKSGRNILKIDAVPVKPIRKSTVTMAGLLNYAYEAILSLFANKLRSILSILGVMIGVAAVIAMLAIGTGAQKQVEQSFASMGTNLLMVTNSFRSRGVALAADTVTRFTFDDLAALKEIESVSRVAPYVQGRAQVVFQGKNWNTRVLGSSPDYQHIRNAVPLIGHFFSDSDVTGRAKVAVLGKTVATELFGENDPVGKQVRINRINFKVIGVLPEKGATGFQNADDQILVPISTAMYRLLGTDYINYFDVQVSNADSIGPVQDEIIPVISKLHRFSEQQMDSIEVRNMADIQKAASEMIATFALLLGSIAAVSLLVGGIGIMNIMLVLVMERTHEIGLRKALGAENRDIMIQFLVESVLICTVGGALGIIFGSLFSLAISSFFGWYVTVSLSSIILAFSFSVFVGVAFGLWPAWRAAQLQPVEALRYE